MLVLVHSPKGGVGSSFVTAMLAQNLAARGHQVTAVDFTYQDAIKLYFGLLPNQPIAEMSDPPGDTMTVAGVELMNGYVFSRSRAFVEGVHSGDLTLFGEERITLIDVGADDRELKALLMDRAALHICTLTATPAALAVLAQVEPGRPTVSLSKTAFVLNQLDDRKRLSRHSSSFVRELLGDKLLGSIRFDEALNESLAMFEPLSKFAPSSVLLPDLDRLATALEIRLGLVDPVEGRADLRKIAQ
jgi:cellulose biosynthesis protein BcsQ